MDGMGVCQRNEPVRFRSDLQLSQSMLQSSLSLYVKGLRLKRLHFFLSLFFQSHEAEESR